MNDNEASTYPAVLMRCPPKHKQRMTTKTEKAALRFFRLAFGMSPSQSPGACNQQVNPKP